VFDYSYSSDEYDKDATRGLLRQKIRMKDKGDMVDFYDKEYEHETITVDRK
jgi:hypothetical protein